MTARELRARRAALIDQAKAIMTTSATGALSAEQRASFDTLMSQADAIKGDIERVELLDSELATLEQSAGTRAGRPDTEINMPNVNTQTRRGDSEERAFLHYMRSGDRSRELRASNDTDLNIGTAADGGVAVPTALYNRIIAKRNETMLADKVGVLRIGGGVKGTTMDAAVDNGTANEFVSTAETVANDRDAPVLAKKSLTLVTYTKKLQPSVELLSDEDASLMTFLENYIGRAYGKTHNSLLVAEALASGTTNALAAAAAATASDIPELVYALPDGYQDNPVWIMRRASEGAYRALVGSVFQFVPTPNGPLNTLWASPIFNSAYVEAVATGKKSLIYGNFNFMLLREVPELVLLRDPYSNAANRQVNLHYFFRAVYKLSVAEAIQYGTHP